MENKNLCNYDTFLKSLCLCSMNRMYSKKENKQHGVFEKCVYVTEKKLGAKHNSF